MNAPDRTPWAARRAPYFAAGLAEADPAMAALVGREERRQQNELELIASENIVSRAVLEAQGSAVCNKTVEGYPGARYHGGAHVVDEIEQLAIERACRIFGTRFANVQPHSGSQANLAVFKALLQPGDCVLSMDLRAGGHLSHGAKANLSGQYYRIVAYGVRPQDGWLDYEGLAQLALEHRPKLIVAGGSSYPRALDLAALRRAADSVGAKLLVDMAHFAGLVAGKVLDNPAGVADVATTTTYKSLRGARGGLILWNDEALTRKLQAAIFPGVQGSPLMHMLAAKAVGLGEALDPSFADYARRVQANAQALAKALLDHGLRLVTGGTDLPLLLVDLSALPVHGAAASDFLGKLGLTCNKNLVPNDPRPPQESSGLRFGVSALTTRGLDEDEMRRIGGWIATALKALATGGEEGLAEIRAGVHELTQRHPIYQ
jgi:glycine hydroxymethyltransferase